MGFVIGIDEAGYGPNLGPLVITATVWRTPGNEKAGDLYGLLRKVVTHTEGKAGTRKVALADSKALYSPQRGIGVLERGVLAMVGAAGQTAADWRAMWNGIAADSVDALNREPWHAGFNCLLPLTADPVKQDRASRRLADGLVAAGVDLVAIRSRAVFPAEFNSLVQAHGGKAEALSRVSIGLAAETLAPLGGGPLEVVCDKHGGRNHYGRFLQRQFPDVLVEHFGEGREESSYRLGPADRRIEFRFCVRGEAYLPVAAASMVSKYLRELSMRAFNQFWQARVPQLDPTAGYPKDSWRFKRTIAAAQAALGIEDDVMWRER